MAFPELGRAYALQNKATGFALTGWWQVGMEPARTVWASPIGNPLGGPQAWGFVESADPGFYHFQSGDQLRLDSNAERQVYLTLNNDGSYQKWRMIDGGEGYWCLWNLATGYALDSNLDEDVYTMRPNVGAFQRWKLLPL